VNGTLSGLIFILILIAGDSPVLHHYYMSMLLKMPIHEPVIWTAHYNLEVFSLKLMAIPVNSIL